MKRLFVVVVALAVLAAVPAARENKLTLRSPAFSSGGEIPRRFTCQGANVSPPLAWSGVPAGTKSLVLIVEDPDAPDPRRPKLVWKHWLLYDIPPSATGLPEGVAAGKLPPGTRQGLNSWKKTGYGGPCPPLGRHRYFHRLFALDKVLGDLQKPDRGKLAAAMQGHILARAELVGTYQKR
ncbi:MAG: YbhB/YbcL family Raf kinase inhibitor-like protein [Deltaproteobacteria bacterium]|nr:MAG: YbhB/YbcL family Raf kinase inhibitor-like protein [Deltaproteobacteria bacterium]